MSARMSVSPGLCRLAGASLLVSAGAGLADEPLSAIDWLSDSITAPVVSSAPEPAASPGRPVEAIVTSPIDGPRPDAVGLLPPSVTGLPARLWGSGDPAEIARLLRRESVDTLPAGQALLTTILLAEAEPPDAALPDGALLLARIDKLLDLGLVEEAGALLERAGVTSPELFRRAFDVSLLLGRENEACEALRARPDVAPTFPVRVFCLARGGDWNAAALTLGTAGALGQINPEEEALLARFLDPDMFEGDHVQPPPRPSPLVFRLQEAVGEPLSTVTLPRAFAQADLRDSAGWKAQLDAGERLARTGALDANRLLGLYTERRAAASGGVWDRVKAMQALDRAMGAGDDGAVAGALPAAWERMREAGLGPVLGALYGERLARMPLDGPAAALAFRIALLSPGYESAAAAHVPADREEELLTAIARGLPPPRVGGVSQVALSGLAEGALPPARTAAQIKAGRLGEALLHALDDLAAGKAGDPRLMSDALASLRAMGLESTARRAALEYLILGEPA